MLYLRVKNWAEFQHYKDRNPPWIKLHRALLDDYEFSRLQDASKAHLVMLWLFASQNGGRIPDDPKFLQTKLSLDKQPDLQAFEEQGFLIQEQNASGTQAESKQDDSNVLALARSREKRREETEESTRAFANFWLAYPRRVSKQDAVKAWKKLAPSAELVVKLMESLDSWKKSDQWTKDGGQFVPHPSTWLNKRRFDDEVQEAHDGALYSREGVM